MISESEARNPLPDGNYAVRNSRGKVYNMDVGLTSCARGKKSRRNAVPLADLLKPDAVITVEREYGSAGGRAVLR